MEGHTPLPSHTIVLHVPKYVTIRTLHGEAKLLPRGFQDPVSTRRSDRHLNPKSPDNPSTPLVSSKQGSKVAFNLTTTTHTYSEGKEEEEEAAPKRHWSEKDCACLINTDACLINTDATDKEGVAADSLSDKEVVKAMKETGVRICKGCTPQLKEGPVTVFTPVGEYWDRDGRVRLGAAKAAEKNKEYDCRRNENQKSFDKRKQIGIRAFTEELDADLLKELIPENIPREKITCADGNYKDMSEQVKAIAEMYREGAQGSSRDTAGRDSLTREKYITDVIDREALHRRVKIEIDDDGQLLLRGFSIKPEAKELRYLQATLNDIFKSLFQELSGDTSCDVGELKEKEKEEKERKVEEMRQSCSDFLRRMNISTIENPQLGDVLSVKLVDRNIENGTRVKIQGLEKEDEKHLNGKFGVVRRIIADDTSDSSREDQLKVQHLTVFVEGKNANVIVSLANVSAEQPSPPEYVVKYTTRNARLPGEIDEEEAATIRSILKDNKRKFNDLRKSMRGDKWSWFYKELKRELADLTSKFIEKSMWTKLKLSWMSKMDKGLEIAGEDLAKYTSMLSRTGLGLNGYTGLGINADPKKSGETTFQVVVQQSTKDPKNGPAVAAADLVESGMKVFAQRITDEQDRRDGNVAADATADPEYEEATLVLEDKKHRPDPSGRSAWLKFQDGQVVAVPLEQIKLQTFRTTLECTNNPFHAGADGCKVISFSTENPEEMKSILSEMPMKAVAKAAKHELKRMAPAKRAALNALKPKLEPELRTKKGIEWEQAELVLAEWKQAELLDRVVKEVNRKQLLEKFLVWFERLVKGAEEQARTAKAEAAKEEVGAAEAAKEGGAGSSETSEAAEGDETSEGAEAAGASGDEEELQQHNGDAASSSKQATVMFQLQLKPAACSCDLCLKVCYHCSQLKNDHEIHKVGCTTQEARDKRNDTSVSSVRSRRLDATSSDTWDEAERIALNEAWINSAFLQMTISGKRSANDNQRFLAISNMLAERGKRRLPSECRSKCLRGTRDWNEREVECLREAVAKVVASGELFISHELRYQKIWERATVIYGQASVRNGTAAEFRPLPFECFAKKQQLPDQWAEVKSQKDPKWQNHTFREQSSEAVIRPILVSLGITAGHWSTVYSGIDALETIRVEFVVPGAKGKSVVGSFLEEVLRRFRRSGIGTKRGAGSITVHDVMVYQDEENEEKTRTSREVMDLIEDLRERFEPELGAQGMTWKEATVVLAVEPQQDLTSAKQEWWDEVVKKVRDKQQESKLAKWTEVFTGKFYDSIHARILVEQAVDRITQGATFTFDFLILVVTASILAGVGLITNNTVVIVASMLVSPIMGPVMAVTFGSSIKKPRTKEEPNKKDTGEYLRDLGFISECLALTLCVLVGFILGIFSVGFEGSRWSGNDALALDWPTPEMKGRGEWHGMIPGLIIAIFSGFGVAVSFLSENGNSLVGVAISASLLPPAVNFGICIARAMVSSEDDEVGQLKFFEMGCCSFLLTILNIVCIYFSAYTMFVWKHTIHYNGKSSFYSAMAKYKNDAVDQERQEYKVAKKLKVAKSTKEGLEGSLEVKGDGGDIGAAGEYTKLQATEGGMPMYGKREWRIWYVPEQHRWYIGNERFVGSRTGFAYGVSIGTPDKVPAGTWCQKRKAYWVLDVSFANGAVTKHVTNSAGLKKVMKEISTPTALARARAQNLLGVVTTVEIKGIEQGELKEKMGVYKRVSNWRGSMQWAEKKKEEEGGSAMQHMVDYHIVNAHSAESKIPPTVQVEAKFDEKGEKGKWVQGEVVSDMNSSGKYEVRTAITAIGTTIMAADGSEIVVSPDGRSIKIVPPAGSTGSTTKFKIRDDKTVQYTPSGYASGSDDRTDDGETDPDGSKSFVLPDEGTITMRADGKKIVSVLAGGTVSVTTTIQKRRRLTVILKWVESGNSISGNRRMVESKTTAEVANARRTYKDVDAKDGTIIREVREEYVRLADDFGLYNNRSVYSNGNGFLYTTKGGRWVVSRAFAQPSDADMRSPSPSSLLKAELMCCSIVARCRTRSCSPQREKLPHCRSLLISPTDVTPSTWQVSALTPKGIRKWTGEKKLLLEDASQKGQGDEVAADEAAADEAADDADGDLGTVVVTVPLTVFPLTDLWLSLTEAGTCSPRAVAADDAPPSTSLSHFLNPEFQDEMAKFYSEKQAEKEAIEEDEDGAAISKYNEAADVREGSLFDTPQRTPSKSRGWRSLKKVSV
jgi:hypothetical protein